MARQEINIGAAANDGTGDSLRNALDKTNQNTQELYHNTLDTKTDNYTLVLGDEQHLIKANKATAIAFTIPPNSDVAFPIGTRIRFQRIGVGVLTFVAGAGVTITGSSGALTDAGLNVEMLLEKTGTNSWGLQNGSPGTYVDYVPTYGGFSANPTSVTARYVLLGKMCHVYVLMGANGTSNATTFTITLPFAAANTAIQSAALSTVVNNSSVLTAPGRIDTIVNSATANLYTTAGAAAWTSSGGKRAFVNLTYEIA